MKRQLVIVLAGVLLPICLVALSQQRGAGEHRQSNPPAPERDGEKKILAVSTK